MVSALKRISGFPEEIPLNKDIFQHSSHVYDTLFELRNIFSNASYGLSQLAPKRMKTRIRVSTDCSQQDMARFTVSCSSQRIRDWILLRINNPTILMALAVFKATGCKVSMC